MKKTAMKKAAMKTAIKNETAMKKLAASENGEGGKAGAKTGMTEHDRLQATRV